MACWPKSLISIFQRATLDNNPKAFFVLLISKDQVMTGFVGIRFGVLVEHNR